MTVAPIPRWLGPPGRRLFATWHPAAAPARMTLVVCPPLFHERVLGYRLFGLVAARLATAGIACLRFDYYGSGDSAGTDADFDLAGAAADVATAVAAARAWSPSNASIGLLAVRGGGWPAWAAAADDPAITHCWFWQPLRYGADYLERLQRIDAAERATRAAPPFCRPPSSYREDGQLTGYACPEPLQRALRDARLPARELPAGTTCGVLDLPQALGDASFATHRIELPESATQWADTLKVRAAFLSRELTESIDRLASALSA